MPGYLLHKGATVFCAHGGSAEPATVSMHVRAGGEWIVTLKDCYRVSGCAMPSPPSGNGPCLTAQWVVGATRVRANGAAVLLLDSQAACAPTGTPLTVVVTQTRVRGI